MFEMLESSNQFIEFHLLVLDLLRGVIYFWQVAEWGTYFWGKKNLKKHAKLIFLRILGKNKTKTFEKNIPGVGCIFDGLEENIWPI